MQSSNNHHNLRQSQRVSLNLPIELSFGSQITLQGEIKDLSLKSAFIKMRESIYLQTNDEVNFAIKRSLNSVEEFVRGLARISRVAAGEGIAIYFTKMDENSSSRLKKWVEV